MGFFDFNTAEPQASGELIPAKTLVKVISAIRSGGGGDDLYLTISDSGFEYLNFEFTIISSPMAKRKIFQNVGVGGTTDGHAKAAEISRSLIRAMLESARGVDPKDVTDKANAARRIQSWADLDQMEFAIEVGIEKGKGGYEDRNKIQRVLTPDHPQYQNVMAGNTVLPEKGAKSTAAVVAAPAWQKEAPVQAASTVSSAIPAWAK